tara:strand:+ start:45 stop:506 length:462 start_codon:yes stop_codon:yes gene_type:complete
MSLLKAYSITRNTGRSLEKIKTDFMRSIEYCVVDLTNIGKNDIAHLIKYYVEYSTVYLSKVAQTLEEPKLASETMKFMNSFIVSILYEAELHYYDKDKGFSLIDKAVQEALDNNGIITVDYAIALIDEVEESYVEEEFDIEAEEEIVAENDGG